MNEYDQYSIPFQLCILMSSEDAIGILPGCSVSNPNIEVMAVLWGLGLHSVHLSQHYLHNSFYFLHALVYNRLSNNTIRTPALTVAILKKCGIPVQRNYQITFFRVF